MICVSLRLSPSAVSQRFCSSLPEIVMSAFGAASAIVFATCPKATHLNPWYSFDHVPSAAFLDICCEMLNLRKPFSLLANDSLYWSASEGASFPSGQTVPEIIVLFIVNISFLLFVFVVFVVVDVVVAAYYRLFCSWLQDCIRLLGGGGCLPGLVWLVFLSSRTVLSKDIFGSRFQVSA